MRYVLTIDDIIMTPISHFRERGEIEKPNFHAKRETTYLLSLKIITSIGKKDSEKSKKKHEESHVKIKLGTSGDENCVCFS